MKAKLSPFGLLVLISCITILSACNKDTFKKANSTKDVTEPGLKSSKPVIAYPLGMGEYITYPMSDGTEITLQKVNNEYIYGGDIVLSELQLKAIQQNSVASKLTVDGVIKPNSTFVSANVLLWPNAVVYYTINNSVNQNDIIMAMNDWSQKTKIKFQQRTTQANYVEFAPAPSAGAAGDSQLGMVGGKQQIRLVDHAGYQTIVHEIGHAVGLMHEQVRADRDNYINVNYGNMTGNWHYQYDKYAGITGYQVGPFDYQSVMIYSSYYEVVGFPGNNSPQMTAKDGSTWSQGGDLSQGDINGVTYMYNNLFFKLRFVNVPLPVIPDLERREYSIYVDFYSDAACTIPKTITADTRVDITESTQSWTTNTHPVNSNAIYSRIIPAGTANSYSIFSNYLTRKIDDRDDGVVRQSFTKTLNIGGWVGYVVVTPNVYR